MCSFVHANATLGSTVVLPAKGSTRLQSCVLHNAVLFFFSMKGFSCSAISSSSFPSSLSVPVFSSSVALSQKSPYCSYKWHTRVITPSYRQDKKRRSVLLSAILCDAAIHLVPPSSRSLVSSGRGVFSSSHRLISHSIRIVSSRLVPRVG